MVKVFNSPFKVTQKFGVNADYYKQFGLAGHEGIDLIPTGSDWTILSLPFKGQVVKDIDMADKGGNYGITCTVWYEEINEAWQYCHMASNNVYVGMQIPPEFKLGIMGNTGNTTGPHLHVNRFQVDSAGKRKNKDNGYLGGIDPLPFIQQDLSPTPEPQESEEDKVNDRVIASLIAYRLEREQGPEGTFEGLVAAIIGSDRSMPARVKEIATLKSQANTFDSKLQVALDAQKKTLIDAADQEKQTSDIEWQKKVETAKKTALKDLSKSELLTAFFEKLFGGGDKA